jgi:metallo-beta-lactamase family protein
MTFQTGFENNGSPELMFHGAAQTVTGSMHLLRIGETIVSMDCGLFQGRRAEAIDRNTKFPVPPRAIDSVLLSHAHIDHSGNLPQLHKRGFTGRIFATEATTDLCEIMLLDSGHIHEEDARYWNEKRARTKQEQIEPLYTTEDAAATMKLFQQIPYGQKFAFADGAFCTFLDAGHILGSATLLIELEKPHPVRLLYTGDLGRADMPILRDPTELPPADYLITECTYANRKHSNPTDMKDQLARVVNETRARGGTVIIPSFSVGRTQNVAYYLVQALHEGLIDPLPIFVDSPLSVNATEVFAKHSECYDREAKDEWTNHKGDIFGHDVIRYVTTVDESKTLNSLDEPKVIIASSGMCEAGRILHHLKNNIEDDNNTICVVGFMAQHTLGRRIVERRREVKIFGRMYPLMARVEILNGFSAHADADDLLRLLGPICPDLKGAFVVHGEGPQPLAMRNLLRKAGAKNVQIPCPGETFPLL